MKTHYRLLTIFVFLISNFAMPSFAATPGPMPKPGIYKSKCGELTVLQVVKKESKFTLKLDVTDCKMNSGTIEKATAFQACSDECTWIFQYDEFPDCRFWLDVKGDVIELNGNEDPAACGFGNRVYGNGKYSRAK
jgi:hypothetical protein